MNFSDVEKDLGQLIGLQLKSIIPGSEITIVEIDSEQNHILLETATGKKKSRPLDELRKIWEELQKNPAVHVERVLNGSGSSRNQPETILANLPYIEWLRISGKKHISYVGKQTHPYGTIKEMTVVDASKIISNSQEIDDRKRFSALVVTSSLHDISEDLKRHFHGSVKALSQGIYKFECDSELIVLCSPEATGIREGTYPVLKLRGGKSLAKSIMLFGTSYTVYCHDDVRILVEQ